MFVLPYTWHVDWFWAKKSYFRCIFKKILHFVSHNKLGFLAASFFKFWEKYIFKCQQQKNINKCQFAMLKCFSHATLIPWNSIVRSRKMARCMQENKCWCVLWLPLMDKISFILILFWMSNYLANVTSSCSIFGAQHLIYVW